jgi:hypothetical protein
MEELGNMETTGIHPNRWKPWQPPVGEIAQLFSVTSLSRFDTYNVTMKGYAGNKTVTIEF